MIETLHSGFDFDIATLLKPISAQAPSGDLLRYEGTYDRIMEARREDDATLAQGVWQRELKKADWNLTSQICLEALQKRSKDLQIAAWLLEAWLHLYGFAGVSAGCRLLVDLCHDFWESLHPTLEDPEYRIAPIHWIDEKLSTQLKLIPITSPENPDSMPRYTWADWDSAFRLQQTRQPELKKNAVTVDMFQQSAYLTPMPFFHALADDVNTAYSCCNDLEAIFDKAFGKENSSLRQFRGVLESVLSLLPSLAAGRNDGELQIAEAEAGQEYVLEHVEMHDSAMAAMLPPIRSRAEAYRRLAEVADFLVRTEPHSPASYLIRRVIAWGGMSLEQLLPELVSNDATLKDLERLLNIETVASNLTKKK
jgi:type VI secretion system protein ImpA